MGANRGKSVGPLCYLIGIGQRERTMKMIKCDIGVQDAIIATPLTNEVRFCEICDNATLWAWCAPADQDVCLICHDADVFHMGGWGFENYHDFTS